LSIFMGFFSPFFHFPHNFPHTNVFYRISEAFLSEFMPPNTAQKL